MRLAWLVRMAAVLLAPLCVVGCTDIVLNPLSPDTARRQVVDVSRQIVSDLGAEAADAGVGFSSCGINGKSPFQAHGRLMLWMPDADRSREVTVDSVLDRLRQHGWQTDPDYHTHAVAFERDGTKVEVWVIPPPKPDQPPVAHVMVDIYGDCRVTFDDESDRSSYVLPDIRGEFTSG